MSSPERFGGLSILAPSVVFSFALAGMASPVFAAETQKVSAKTAAKAIDERRIDLEKRELDLRKEELRLEQRRAEIESEKQKIADEAAVHDVITIQLQGEVLFDFSKARIRPESEGTLEKVAAVLQQFPDGQIAIVGHTDSVGSAETNLALSKARAAAVREWLAGKGGLDAKQIVVDGQGESKPLAPNELADGSDNPAGRQSNRRVEIKIAEADRKDGVTIGATR